MAKNAKYRQIVDWITSEIGRKELLPGDKLESENSICARFSVSRQTVRHALGILARDGVIESRQGSGSFVKEPDGTEQKSTGGQTIAIVSTYVNGYIFPNVIQGMEQVLGNAGFNIQINFTHNRKGTEKDILKKLMDDPDLAGVIIEPTMSGLPNTNRKYYDRLKKQRIPVLFFNSFYEGLDIPHVSLNDEAAGRSLVDYLASMGHKKIGGIFKLDDGQGRLRYKGFMKGVSAAGLSVNESNVIWIDTDDQMHMGFCKEKILRRLQNCTACVCYNDVVAHDLTEMCVQDKIRIPEDLSIVSIDNSELARLNFVPLTSVKHPMAQLGIKAAQNMLHMIKEPDFAATYEFDAQLELRNSVRKL